MTKKSKFHRGEYTIAFNPYIDVLKTKGNKRTGLIHSSGLFAIQKEINDVTHLPSGLRIHSVSTNFTLKQAREYVERLVALPAEWDKLNNDNVSGFKVGGKSLGEAIKETIKDILG